MSSPNLEWSLQLQEVYEKSLLLKRFKAIEISERCGITVETARKYLQILKSLNLLKSIIRGNKIFFEVKNG